MTDPDRERAWRITNERCDWEGCAPGEGKCGPCMLVDKIVAFVRDREAKVKQLLLRQRREGLLVQVEAARLESIELLLREEVKRLKDHAVALDQGWQKRWELGVAEARAEQREEDLTQVVRIIHGDPHGFKIARRSDIERALPPLEVKS